MSRKQKKHQLRHSKRKTLSRAAKIWISVGVTFLVLLLAALVWVGCYLWNLHQLAQGSMGPEHEISSDPEDLDIDTTIDWPEGITNIALFGIDSRSNNMKGLSDSIMIISVDAVHNSIKLVSVMRDTLVKIDGHGYQKINAAYSLGGPELAVKTLNKTFNLNIMDYATVDFVGMAEIVDAVGGIEAELTAAEVKNANIQVNEMANTRKTPRDLIKSPGKQVLNGIQAVAFARIRKVATIKGTRDDFGRTERQRLVMSQLFQKALKLELSQYPNFIKTVLPFVQTSLDYEDIFDLAKILLKEGISMKQDRIPVDKAIINADFRPKGIGSCVYYDLNFAGKLLHSFIFDDITFDVYIQANGVERNQWYTGPMANPSTGSSGSEDDPTTDTEVTDTEFTDTEFTDTSGGGGVTDTTGAEGSSGASGDHSDSGGTTDSGNPSDTETDAGSSSQPTDSSSSGSSEPSADDSSDAAA